MTTTLKARINLDQQRAALLVEFGGVMNRAFSAQLAFMSLGLAPGFNDAAPLALSA
jgi:hypothetical protein